MFNFVSDYKANNPLTHFSDDELGRKFSSCIWVSTVNTACVRACACISGVCGWVRACVLFWGGRAPVAFVIHLQANWCTFSKRYFRFWIIKLWKTNCHSLFLSTCSNEAGCIWYVGRCYIEFWTTVLLSRKWQCDWGSQTFLKRTVKQERLIIYSRHHNSPTPPHPNVTTTEVNLNNCVLTSWLLQNIDMVYSVSQRIS